ncbi:hypothetical protein [Candidatus Contubernalis alkaliaceticus]|uniref:hypothetical protein n=1 Tax=Candidatus Contubernalis alkaliaceticus TaxID=338645 RepID=UPI001F4C1475|nr:hypothetical protein [Candidatus Contubernalis alkalaceticus]UNC93177.1 CRISPR-associated protein [Candidatus Contubernalis alkalaceticus]
MPCAIISSLGTSLLTNFATNGVKKIVHLTANSKSGEIQKEQIRIIEELRIKVESRLKESKPQVFRKYSAELNGIYGYYEVSGLKDESLERDVHFLIASDTYQGQLTGKLIMNHLKCTGFKHVEIITPEGFNTKNTKNFKNGVSKIVKWCESTVSPYRESRYHIVFNLVGGFKSLQGYLNTLGMFYADEIIYIFDGVGSDLIRIPRLPVKMDEFPVLREQAVLFALMEHGYFACKNEVQGIPELMLEDDGDCYTLDPVGLLLWERNKVEILGSSELLSFPGLLMQDSFSKDFNSVKENKKKAVIQNDLAKASLLFKEKGLAGLRSDGGFLYETYKNVKGNVGHFRLDQDWRISCLPDGDILRLRHVGNHDYVNNMETR